jgi:aerobic carbon-monoxide dehydrogenase large subunit
MVLADNRYVAEDAAELVEIDIDPLPPVSDCGDASAPGSPDVHIRRKGNRLIDFGKATAMPTEAREAPLRLSLSLKQHRGGAHPIECRRVLANFDSIEDRLTVWLSS